MDREQVIVEFCKLSDAVAKHFKYQYAVDCFCKESRFKEPHLSAHYQFDERVFEFINDAVMDKIHSKS